VWRVNFVGSTGCACDLPLKTKKEHLIDLSIQSFTFCLLELTML